MHDHRFHLILTTGLAICLGAAGALALLPSDAIGYPAGSAVSMCETRVSLERSDGEMLGMFWVSGGYGTSYDTLAIQQTFSSGLRLSGGQHLTMSSSSGSAVAYTFSGYQAQP